MCRRACMAGACATLLAFTGCGVPHTRTTTPAMTPAPAFTELGDVRRFAIRYVARVTEVPAGTARLRLWLPVPSTTPLQTIGDLRFDAPVEPQVRTEPTLGNRIAYFEWTAPPTAVTVTMQFSVARREVHAALATLRDVSVEPADPSDPWLQPSRLEIVDARVKALAEAVTAGRSSVVAKARAIYDYVLDHMDYDKSVPGWGQGDTARACDVGKGNCTDFHALFVSLARAAGIPAGFQVGLYLPYEVGRNEAVGGYHCWAWFEVPGRTWVPVDVSEADQEPDRATFFFGGHTNNRVTLSVGRDVPLEPAQAGPPLNYFVDPYAEADGVPVRATKAWSYRDL